MDGAPPTGRVEKGDAETEEWRIEGAVESFSERIKARARSISAPRVTKE